MPQRTREHELDDEARRAFESALPSAWVFRPTDSRDYGVDGSVEVFENERPTGEVFNVQLKGTDAAGSGAGSTARVKVDTAEYWSRLQLPTLVVRYHADSGQLYVRWWHQHPFDPAPEQQTLTFGFRAQDEWRDSTPSDLTQGVRAYHRLRSARLELPLKIHAVPASETIHSLPASVVTLKLRSAAERLPRLVEIRSDPPSAGSATVTLSDERTEVDLGGVGVTLHHDVPYGAQRSVDLIGFDSLLAVSLALARIGLASAAASIANLALRNSTLVADPHLLARVGSVFLAAHRVTEGAGLAAHLLSNGSPTASVGTMAVELSRGPGAPALGDDVALRDLLLSIAQQAESEHPELAADCWLRAAHRQARTSPGDAVTSFRRASALMPEFEQEVRWWAGLAGAAHDAGELDVSIEAYRTALEMGGDVEQLAGLADSLLAAGRFDEAANSFDEYVQAGTADPKWIASRTVASWLAGEALAGWREALQAKGGELEVGAEKALPDVIEFSRAWFNCGVRRADHGGHGEALRCFLAAVVLFPADDESWVQSVVSAFNAGDPSLMINIIQSGYVQRGYAFVDEVMGRTDDLSFAIRQNFMSVVEMVISGQAFVDEGPSTE